MHTIISHIRISQAVVAIMAAGALFLCFSVQPAAAQVSSAATVSQQEITHLQNLIQSLVVQLNTLRAQMGATDSRVTVDVSVAPDDRIEVTTNNLNVRDTPNGTLSARVVNGMSGVVIDQPRSGGLYTWLKVRFDNGAEGWVASAFTRVTDRRAAEVADVDDAEAEQAVRCVSGSRTYGVGTQRQSIIENGRVKNVVDAYYVCGTDGKWKVEGSLPEPTVTTCSSGNREYRVGSKLRSIVENGQTRDVMDGYFICGTNGQWKVDGSLPAPKATCTSGNREYSVGTQRQSIIENGQTKNVTDAYYVCGANGAWMIEGSLPAPKVMCSSGNREYSIGTKTQSIVENGQTRDVMDGYFICGADGKWKIEGSLPAPKVTCTSDTKVYSVGTKLQTIIEDGMTKDVMDAYYVCGTDGKWKVEGSLPAPTPQPKTTATHAISLSQITETLKQMQASLAAFQ